MPKCQICVSDAPAASMSACCGAVCSNCQHAYVRTQINSKLSYQKYIVWPVCAYCSVSMADDVLNQLLSDGELRQLELAFQDTTNSPWSRRYFACSACGTETHGWQLEEAGMMVSGARYKTPTLRYFTCPVCYEDSCLMCEGYAEDHAGLSCLDYLTRVSRDGYDVAGGFGAKNASFYFAETEPVETLFRSSAKTHARIQLANLEWKMANSKQCKHCGQHIEKNAGCNHMVCTVCAFEFCWVCEYEDFSLFDQEVCVHGIVRGFSQDV